MLHGLLSWWRGFGGRGGVRAPRTRVVLPVAHDLPAGLLPALRLVDPMLDAYVLRDGNLWILQQQPNRGRIQAGREILTLERTDQLEDYLGLNVEAHLMAQGFALIGHLAPHEFSIDRAVESAQRTLGRSEADMEYERLRIKLASDPAKKHEQRRLWFRERLAAEGRGLWAWAYRGRRGVHVNRNLNTGS